MSLFDKLMDNPPKSILQLPIWIPATEAALALGYSYNGFLSRMRRGAVPPWCLWKAAKSHWLIWRGYVEWPNLCEQFQEYIEQRPLKEITLEELKAFFGREIGTTMLEVLNLLRALIAPTPQSSDESPACSAPSALPDPLTTAQRQVGGDPV